MVLGGLADGEGQHHLRPEGLPALPGEPRRRCANTSRCGPAAVASSVSRHRPSASVTPVGQQLLVRRAAGRRSPAAGPAQRRRPARASRRSRRRAPAPAAPVICASCSVTSARSTSGVVGQPAVQLGQHLLRRPARRADQEHLVEALLVGPVAPASAARTAASAAGHRALLAPGRRGLGRRALHPVADPRMGGQRADTSAQGSARLTSSARATSASADPYGRPATTVGGEGRRGVAGAQRLQQPLHRLGVHAVQRVSGTAERMPSHDPRGAARRARPAAGPGGRRPAGRLPGRVVRPGSRCTPSTSRPTPSSPGWCRPGAGGAGRARRARPARPRPGRRPGRAGAAPGARASWAPSRSRTCGSTPRTATAARRTPRTTT